MKYRRLGKSGLKVSEISLGSWLTFGGYVNKGESSRIIKTAYDRGVNFFDTANEYALGEAEKIVGDSLKNYRRDSYVLATKVFYPMGDGPNDRGLSRKHIVEQVNASLKRLKVDYIDLLYCHRFDEETPLEETLRAIDDLVRQGKVLYVGVSQWSSSQIEEAFQITDKYLLEKIVVNQPYYNMFQRYIEKDIIEYCEKKGVGQVVFSPLAEGVLAGRYKSTESLDRESRAYNTRWNLQTSKSHPKSPDPKKALHGWDLLKESRLNKAKSLQNLADELNLTLPQLSLSWVLRHSNIASAIVGASTPEQIINNCGCSGISLSSETIIEIDNILSVNDNEHLGIR